MASKIVPPYHYSPPTETETNQNSCSIANTKDESLIFYFFGDS